MRLYRWDIDDQTSVEAKYSIFTGKEEIFVNNLLVSSKRNFGFKSKTEFNIDSYRTGLIQVTALSHVPDVELSINGKIYIHNQTGIKASCPKCNTDAKLNDSFCQSCGAQLPEAHFLLKSTKVKEAGQTILVLSVMFLIFGVIMFFIQKGTYDQALTNISSYNPSDIYPQLVNGKNYTIAELRNQLYIEKWGILGLNLFLAALMFGLSRWSKKAPLPALIVASSVYLAVIVLNAILDPRSIGQGIIMKIIIISMLYKGIKAASEARPKPEYAKA